MADPTQKPLTSDENSEKNESFADLAAEKSPGFLGEFWAFLRQNKKWWLTPIFIILLLLILLVIISQTPLAPFIYPIF